MIVERFFHEKERRHFIVVNGVSIEEVRDFLDVSLGLLCGHAAPIQYTDKCLIKVESDKHAMAVILRFS